MSTINRLFLDRSSGAQSRAVPIGRRRAASRTSAQLACTAALLLSDAVAIALTLSCCAAVLSAMGGLHDAGTERGWLRAFAAAAAGLVIYLVARSHYTRRVPFWTELQDVIHAALGASVFTACLTLLNPGLEQGMAPALGWLALPILAVIARKVARSGLIAAGLWQIRTVLVATADNATHTLAALRSEPALGYDVVALIDPAQWSGQTTGPGWRSLLDDFDARLLVLAYDASASPGRRTIESLVRERVPFAVMPQLGGLPALGFDQTRFFSHDTVLVSYRNNLARPMTRLAKIGFDLVLAAAGLFTLAPLLLVVAALVKLDGGPALFGHTRIGVGGRPFRVLKFRSMVTDSEAVLQQLLAADPLAAVEWQQTQKLRNDPRITRIGGFLRRTSLDELPQLINVLRLEMSLVGPRPIVQAEIARYGEDIAYYYETRPGLTGLWQVSGRTETAYAHRVQLDTWYVKNWTIWHDLAIIAKTVPAVLQRRGAC